VSFYRFFQIFELTRVTKNLQIKLPLPNEKVASRLHLVERKNRRMAIVGQGRTSWPWIPQSCKFPEKESIKKINFLEIAQNEKHDQFLNHTQHSIIIIFMVIETGFNIAAKIK
jgi:hypothetical protein